ncbi:neur_chan_LBD domain-containing protein [Trichonephila clavipes]|nr:neur_chan_LBD domain-containing protein [Trichonephila clavipes]
MLNIESKYVSFSLAVWCSEDEERLVRDLFRDYNKLIRPVEAMNQTVVVEFGLSFIQLINVVSIIPLYVIYISGHQSGGPRENFTGPQKNVEYTYLHRVKF